MMTELSIIELISNVGFPIVITLYLIIRFEKIILNNTIAINNLISLIQNKYK